MDLKTAEQLVKKYFAGETSPEEEFQLKEFFRTSENIPEHLMPEKELFSMYTEASDEELPMDDFMENLEKVIDKQTLKAVNFRGTTFYWILGIAAGVALLIGSYFLFLEKPRITNNQLALQDTYTNPKLAYEETQKILLYVSQTINKGTAKLSNVSKITGPVQSLQNLKKLDTGINDLKMLQFLDSNKKN